MKKAYIALSELELNIQLELPQGLIGLIGIFSTKKEALKYSKNIIEVPYVSLTKHN